MHHRRIVWQIFTGYLSISLAALTMVSLIAAVLLRQSHLAAIDGQLERIAREASGQMNTRLRVPIEELDPAALQAECDHFAKLTATRITLIQPDGTVLCDTQENPARMENHGRRPEVLEAINTGLGKSTRYSSTVERTLQYVAVPLRHDGRLTGVLRVAVPLTATEATIAQIQGLLLWSAFAAALVVAGLSYVVARRVSRPLEELSAGARRLADGELELRLVTPDTQEMADVTDALRRLAKQLEEHTHAMGRKGTEQQAVLASMVEGVLAVDSAERVIILNRAAAELIGGRIVDLVGRNLQEVIRNSDLRRFASRALVSDEPIEDDVVLHGESDRVLLVRGTALRDTRAKSIGAVIVLNDVTHYRHLENIRRDFVANVSHELKTPIASIKGFVETLLDGALHEPDDARRFLQIVVKQADRLNAIIEDLLSLSKVEQSEESADLPLETGRIHDVLLSAVGECQSLANDRNIQVSIQCDEALAAAINPPLLQHAIINLIENGVKYSEPGKTVLLKAEASREGTHIHVIDQGCGIDKEHLPRLFERFYRVDRARSRKVGGTGLGLAIVKHIVQAHHGRVSVSSTPGAGSTFTIHLPPPTV